MYVTSGTRAPNHREFRREGSQVVTSDEKNMLKRYEKPEVEVASQ